MRKIKSIIFCTLTIIIAFGFFLVSMKYLMNNFNQWRQEKSNILFEESHNVASSNEKMLLLEQVALLDPTEKNYLEAGILAQELGLNQISKIYFLRIKTAEGFYELGNSYVKLEELDGAIEAYKKAIELDKNDMYFFAIGKTYLKQAKFIQAEDEFLQANNLDQDNKENNYFLLLSNIINTGQMSNLNVYNLNQSELIILEKMFDKSNGQIYISQVFSTLKSQNYPQAAYEYLVTSNKEGELDRNGHLLLANEYFIRENYQASYDNLLKAKELDPYYPQTYQHLIKVAGLLNKTNEVVDFEKTYKLITW
jgi:tetratricopeptide (TPR) repeat protein